MLHGIGLQEASEAGPFACLPKERQEHVRKGVGDAGAALVMG